MVTRVDGARKGEVGCSLVVGRGRMGHPPVTKGKQPHPQCSSFDGMDEQGGVTTTRGRGKNEFFYNNKK